jgi:ankyrin repeat protein
MNDTDPAWYEFRNAIYTKQLSQAEEMLRARPELLHLVNGIGETVFHFLAVENDTDGLSWLHSRGADINTKNAFGTPVLFEVASLKYKDLFKWFMEKGANVRALDQEGQDIILYLLEYDNEEMAEWVNLQIFPELPRENHVSL